MSISDNDKTTYLKLDGFNSSEYAFGTTPNNGATGFTLTDEIEKSILRNKQGAADLKNDNGNGANPVVNPSSSNLPIMDLRTDTSAAYDDSQQPKVESTDALTPSPAPNTDDKQPSDVTVTDPVPDPAPVDELDELKKFTGAPSVKPTGPQTQFDPANVEPAAPFGLTNDADRGARENRVHDLLFDENAFTRFRAGIGPGPFSAGEAMALQLYTAQHSERLSELRALHGEDALRLAATEIVRIFEENRGNPLPSQPYINAQINAAINLALNPDYYIFHDLEHATINELFRPIHNTIEDNLLENNTLSPYARDALRNHLFYYIDEYLTAAESLSSPEELTGARL